MLQSAEQNWRIDQSELYEKENEHNTTKNRHNKYENDRQKAKKEL